MIGLLQIGLTALIIYQVTRIVDDAKTALLWAIVALALFAGYDAKEAHHHAHEAVNACSDKPVYSPRGERL